MSRRITYTCHHGIGIPYTDSSFYGSLWLPPNSQPQLPPNSQPQLPYPQSWPRPRHEAFEVRTSSARCLAVLGGNPTVNSHLAEFFVPIVDSPTSRYPFSTCEWVNVDVSSCGKPHHLELPYRVPHHPRSPQSTPGPTSW